MLFDVFKDGKEGVSPGGHRDVIAILMQNKKGLICRTKHFTNVLIIIELTNRCLLRLAIRESIEKMKCILFDL
jgi:hypothetical protein